MHGSVFPLTILCYSVASTIPLALDMVTSLSLASSPGFPLLGTKNELRRREAWSNSSPVRHFRFSI